LAIANHESNYQSSIQFANRQSRMWQCENIRELFDLLWTQPESRSTNQLVDLPGIARADDGGGDGWVSQRPGDSHLAGRAAVPIGNRAQAIHE
jgi:hypothetical protein